MSSISFTSPSVLVEAGIICKNKDCSDVVGEHMVKDNRGHGHHHHEEYKQHEAWKEEARRHRNEIFKREQN